MSAGSGHGDAPERGDDGELQKQEIELEKSAAAVDLEALGREEVGAAAAAGGEVDTQGFALEEAAAVEVLRSEEFEADEFNFLDDEDMQIFGLNPLNERLDLVSCNFCRKPIIESQFPAHYERCISTLDLEHPLTVTASGDETIETGKGKRRTARRRLATSPEQGQKQEDETDSDSEDDPKGMHVSTSQKSTDETDSDSEDDIPKGIHVSKSKKSPEPAPKKRRAAKVEEHLASTHEKISRSAENRGGPGDLTRQQENLKPKRKSTGGCIATIPVENSQAEARTRVPSLRKRDSQAQAEAETRRSALRKQKRYSHGEARRPGLRKRKGDSLLQAEARRPGLRERKRDGSAVCSRSVKRSHSRKRKQVVSAVTGVSNDRPEPQAKARAGRPRRSHKKRDVKKVGEEVSSGPKQITYARARRGDGKQATKSDSEQEKRLASAGATGPHRQETRFPAKKAPDDTREAPDDARELRRQLPAGAKDQASVKNASKKHSSQRDTSDKLKSSESVKSASCDVDMDKSGNEDGLGTSSMMKDEFQRKNEDIRHENETTESDSDSY